MLRIENTEVSGWEAAIRGLRNPLNSWGRSDSFKCTAESDGSLCDSCRFRNGMTCENTENLFVIGKNDFDLMRRMNASTEQSKYRRMILVTFDVTAPLYWYKEADTYKVGTVCNSCSTMHKITAKEFVLDDFSHEHLTVWDGRIYGNGKKYPADIFAETVEMLNDLRNQYLAETEPAEKKAIWYNIIQLLPSSYNQRRTYLLNYEVLASIYRQRKNHKLDEWHTFCDWIESLPYSELITGGKE